MARMRVLFSFWGILAREDEQTFVETPDGLRGERSFFVDELLRRGHTVIQAQRSHDPKQYSCIVDGERRETMIDATGFPEVDVVFVEWRWKRLGKSLEDWDRQCALLDHYSRMGTPVIAQDTDLKLTEDDELRWPAVVIGDPCLRPGRLARARISMPFCNVFGERGQPGDEPSRYTYVGNNYERQAQFERYYAEPAGRLRALGIQTTVHGNWLTRSPERMHPRAIVQQYTHVAFAPRVAYRDVRGTLGGSLAVCHISKPEYSARGNVTVRYFEAIAAGVPALVPIESALMRDVGDSAGLMVGSTDDVVRKLRNLADMSVIDRALLVESQERALRGLADFSPGHKADLIEAAARRELTA